MTTEIRLLAHITLEVPAELSKEELVNLFNKSLVWIISEDRVSYKTKLDIIDIEEENELYGNS